MTALLVGGLGSLHGGTAVRLRMTVEALATLGPVDMFVVTHPGEGGEVPGGEAARRVAVAYRSVPNPGADVVRWLGSRLPAHLARFDLTAAARDLAAWTTPPYDLLWLFKPDGWVLARQAGLATSQAVCDLDDLDDVRLRATDGMRRLHEARPPELGGMAGAVRRAVWRVDRRRWPRFRRVVVDDVAAVTFCSAVASARAGQPESLVVPNGYPEPTTQRDARRDEGAADGLVMVGSFRYPPNLDGARWFIECVLPRLRRRFPDLELRLVGEHPDRVPAAPGVTWTGFVEDVAAVVTTATLAVAPLRVGAGTAVKVVEAWACGVPVVATPRAAEGFDVTPGRELLVADAAASFADACADLLEDPVRRQALAAAGAEHWRAHHSPAVIRRAVGEAIARVRRSSEHAPSPSSVPVAESFDCVPDCRGACGREVQ